MLDLTVCRALGEVVARKVDDLAKAETPTDKRRERGRLSAALSLQETHWQVCRLCPQGCQLSQTEGTGCIAGSIKEASKH